MSHEAIEARLKKAEVVSIYGTPDMDVLAAGRRPPVKMPTELFGDMYPLLDQLAEGCGAPVDYVALAYLVSAASLIGGKRRVRPFATSNWSEPCILWAAAVGDPSSRKSPALDAVTGPLRAIEQDHALAHADAMRTWQADAERAKLERSAWQDMVKQAQKGGMSTPPLPDAAVDPDEPVRRRTVVQDATPEAMAAILSGNPAGTLHFRDELAGWLTSFDRYSPGGRAYWIETYGGRPHVVDRKGSKGGISVKFNGVSVLGGIQPDKLGPALLSDPDDGLVARFLWAWPDRVPYRRPRSIADMTVLENLYRRLDGLEWGRYADGSYSALTIPLAANAADLFEKWQRANAEGVEDSGALYKGFVGKMDGALLRLALVAELTQWAMRGRDEPEEISLRTVAAAANWVDQYAKPMALRVFGDASLPLVERNAAVLARYIRKNRFARINKRDLMRSPHKAFLPGLRTDATMKPTIDYLVDAGWLIEAGQREGETAGRKREDYIVTPAVMEGGNA